MPTPEFELVLTSAPYPLRPDEIQHLVELCQQVSNWNNVLTLVKRHNIHPTAYLNLERYGGALVPASLLAELKNNYERSKLRSLNLVAELLRIKQAFDSEHIPVAPLKGPLLAKEIFGDVGLRASGDLDLLAPYESFITADRTLHSLGYQLKEPVRPLTPRQWQAYAILNHHTSYYHPDKRLLLEFHWSFANSYLMPLAATRDVMSRIRTINQFGAELSVLSPEDTVVSLLLHGSKHAWARLKWLVDIDALIRNNISIDWEKTVALMLSLNLERPLAQGFLMAQRTFGTSIPVAAQRAIVEIKPTANKLADEAWNTLTTDEDYLLTTGAFAEWQKAQYMASLKRNSVARWQYLAAFLLHSLNDWDDFPLPDNLFPLYYAMRPFTWFWRYFLRH
jgi:hypothetical protein